MSDEREYVWVVEHENGGNYHEHWVTIAICKTIERAKIFASEKAKNDFFREEKNGDLELNSMENFGGTYRVAKCELLA